ncbi:MAG TPA: MauE/DoxX family redox-associated membrane protein [Steroidobacteraceae bacterium]|nr:MauE/DoxX family redox-associated membrane protein [Steroidobacteraceae bacterium]
MTIDPSIALAVRLLGALVFAAAVAGKIRHRHELAGVVANYRLLPEPLAASAAWMIVGLECLVVLSLVSGVRLVAGATLAIVLLVGFALAMAINLARGRREIDCGCFQSGLRQRLSMALVARNILLAALLTPLLAARAPGTVALQWVDGLGAGVAAYALYQVLGELITLRHLSAELRRRFA